MKDVGEVLNNIRKVLKSLDSDDVIAKPVPLTVTLNYAEYVRVWDHVSHTGDPFAVLKMPETFEVLLDGFVVEFRF